MAGGGAAVVRANLRILLRKSLTLQEGALKMRPRFGGVPERPKGSDCKSDVIDFEGSNPSPSTSFQRRLRLARV